MSLFNPRIRAALILILINTNTKTYIEFNAFVQNFILIKIYFERNFDSINCVESTFKYLSNLILS